MKAGAGEEQNVIQDVTEQAVLFVSVFLYLNQHLSFTLHIVLSDHQVMKLKG